MNEQPLGGRYRRVRPLGSGAMGEVWLAEDTLLGRTVAIKQVRASAVVDERDLQRMLREARLAAKLNHPNAVAVHDLVVENGLPHVVMEYVPGRSLAQWIWESGPLDAPQAAHVAAQVAQALAAAHRVGIVHRDVKPANILINEDGVAKLGDFGIARGHDDAALTHTGAMIGTPAYLAPEVARGGPPGPSSDMWSLGATLYAALEGHPPYAGSAGSDINTLAMLSRVMTEPVPLPRRAGPLHGVLMSLLDRDAAGRPAASEAVAMLSSPPQSAGTSTAPLDPPVQEATLVRAPTKPVEPMPVAPLPVAPVPVAPVPVPPVPVAPVPVAPPVSGDVGRGWRAETSPLTPRVDTGPRTRRTWLPWAALAAAVVVLAGVLTAVLLSGGDGNRPPGGQTAAFNETDMRRVVFDYMELLPENRRLTYTAYLSDAFRARESLAAYEARWAPVVRQIARVAEVDVVGGTVVVTRQVTTATGTTEARTRVTLTTDLLIDQESAA